jgi:Flp pilus assembly protein CpaB
MYLMALAPYSPNGRSGTANPSATGDSGSPGCNPARAALIEEGEEVVKRQTLVLVAIGVILFAAGGAIAYISAMKGGKTQTTSNPAAVTVSTPVVVAVRPIPAGTTGQYMVSERLVALQTVTSKEYRSTDLTTLAALNDEIMTTAIAAGQAIRSNEVIASPSGITLPKKMDGMTETFSGTNGLAGYLAPGAHIDIYANITKLSGPGGGAVDPAEATLDVPCTELVATNVEVLDVSSVVPPLGTGLSATGRTVPGSETLLLAISPDQARTLSFMSANEALSIAQTQAGVTSDTIGQCIGTDETVGAS